MTGGAAQGKDHPCMETLRLQRGGREGERGRGMKNGGHKGFKTFCCDKEKGNRRAQLLTKVSVHQQFTEVICSLWNTLYYNYTPREALHQR